MHFFIHNSFQAGDVVLTRPLIEAIRANFQGVSITLETTQNNAYLWKDLGLPIAIYEGIEYHSTASTPNCPPGVVFVNMCFDLFDDIFATYGITYENQVHTFNRQICGYNLQHNYQLAIPQQTPMIKFYYVEQISGFKENGILLEGNEYLPQLAQDFPNLTFYCIEKPSIQMPNIIDCSKFNLIELSVIGNRCIGLIVKNGAVNAITLTEMNRHKPRCIVERNFRFKLWNISEKNTVYTERYSQVKDFFSFAFQISQNKLCKFLKSERDVEECTRYLHQNGYVSHNISFKDWDLAHIINDLSDGNFLDMGSSDSYILKNAVIKGIKGEKYGIDLRHPDVPVIGVKYIIGDLMNTEFPDNYFANITCLSVIEHEVDFNKFAAEIKRLLMVGGKIYLTFDYWTPKITPKIKLYGLAWNILDKNDTEMLIKIFNKNNLHLIDEVDWSLGEALITEKNYSPEPGIHYTFGMLVFQKNTGGGDDYEILRQIADKYSYKSPLAFYQTVIGNYYLPTDAPNDVIIAHMRNGKIFEPEIVEISKQYINQGSTVLDIGANFGQMSLLFSQFTGDDGRIISFEADDYVFYILKKNIIANNCKNIIAYNKAVYDKSGKVMVYPVQDFKRFPAYGSYGLDPNATEGRTIDTISIDDLNIQRPISFMKVDIQGSDIFALRGAVETIRRNHMPILFEFEEQFQQEFKTSWNDYLNFINQIGYKIEKVINSINYLILPIRN